MNNIDIRLWKAARNEVYTFQSAYYPIKDIFIDYDDFKMPRDWNLIVPFVKGWKWIGLVRPYLSLA